VASGAHADAARIATEMSREFGEAYDAYRAARVLAHCVLLAEQDTHVTAAARQSVSEAYWERHRELLEQAVQRAGDQPEVANDLAWFLGCFPDRRFHNPDQAVLLAKRDVAMAPQVGTCWNTLGTVYCRAGQWKDAVATLEKSTQLRSGGDSFDGFFLAMAYQQLGDAQKARQWYDRAVQWMDRNKPQDEELRCFRGEAADMLGIKSEPMRRPSEVSAPKD
jgi:uncharacterized protein HemY